MASFVGGYVQSLGEPSGKSRELIFTNGTTQQLPSHLVYMQTNLIILGMILYPQDMLGAWTEWKNHKYKSLIFHLSSFHCPPGFNELSQDQLSWDSLEINSNFLEINPCHCMLSNAFLLSYVVQPFWRMTFKAEKVVDRIQNLLAQFRSMFLNDYLEVCMFDTILR